jgi:hypothetical protein
MTPSAAGGSHAQSSGQSEEEGMQNKFEWRGIDGAGFQYGFYREGQKQYRLDIAIPGKGISPHRGPDFRILIDGEEAGKAASLPAAMKFLENYFGKGLHKDAGREEPRQRRSFGDTLRAAIEPLSGKRRSGR